MTRFWIGVVLLLVPCAAAFAAASVTEGPCKDADGWVRVKAEDSAGGLVRVAITYECGSGSFQKSAGRSTGGTHIQTARPPVGTCDSGNPVVDVYVNGTKQTGSSGTRYNSLSSCP